MTAGALLHAELTSEIVGGGYAVYRNFGFGFLENVYKNALSVELGYRGLQVRREVPVEVAYRGVPVGAYRVDMLVDDKVVVEVKTQLAITPADKKRLSNYLRATQFEVGLLFNFGPEPTFTRMVYSNSRK